MMFSRTLVILVAVFIGLVPTNVGAQTDSPFAAALTMPNDVDLFVHVNDASQFWAELAERPIAGWMVDVFERSALNEAWQKVAQRAELSPTELAALLIGSELTFAVRNDASGQPSQWVLQTTVARNNMFTLLQQLKVVQHGPDRLPRYSLPEQELVLARRGQQLIIGPMHEDQLFEDVIANQRPDGEHFAHELIRENRAGDFGLFIRHGKQSRDVSAIVGRLGSDQLELNHFTKFADMAVADRQLQMPINPEPLQAGHGNDQLMINITPMRQRGALDRLWPVEVDEHLLSGIDDLLGERRLVAIDWSDTTLGLGGDRSQAVAVAIELRSADSTRVQVDREIQQGLRRIVRTQRSRRGNLQITNDNGMHQVDLGDLTPQIFGETVAPGSSGQLYWDVVECNGSSWCVVASSHDKMQRVISALCSGEALDVAKQPRIESVGALAGSHIGQRIDQLAGELSRTAIISDAGETYLPTMLDAISNLAHSIERASWRMTRPAADRVECEIKLQLGPTTDTQLPSNGPGF